MNMSSKTMGILAIAALLGLVAFFVSLGILDFRGFTSFIIGLIVAIITWVVLWLGWGDDTTAQSGLGSDTGWTEPTSTSTTPHPASQSASTTPVPASTTTAAQPASAAPALSTSTAPVAPQTTVAGLAAVPPATTAKVAPAADASPVKAPKAKSTATPKPAAKPAAKADTAAAKAPKPAAKAAKPADKTAPAAKPAAKKAAPAAKAASATKAAPAAKAKPAPKSAPAAAATPAPVAAVTMAESKPETLSGARAGGADDLKKIKGVGPGLEKTLNELGFYHFDQVAAWDDQEIQWVDSRLKFKGRIVRDEWIKQATEFAKG